MCGYYQRLSLQRSRNIALACSNKERVVQAYLNYDLVAMHGIHCTAHYVAVWNTPVQTSTFVSGSNAYVH
jgi:hypothetical protein